MSVATNGIGSVTPTELEASLRRGERLIVLDVRRRDAWSESPDRIPGAMWLPLEEVPRRARDLPTDAHLVVYCS